MDWPQNDIPLPQTSLAGETGSSVARTQMETGRFRQRDRFGVTQSIYNVEWLLLDEEYQAFKEFFNVDLGNGLGWFNLPLPEDNALTPVEVRFVGGVYRKKYVPVNQWQITAQIERRISDSLEQPAYNPVPIWYRPTIPVAANLTIDSTGSDKLYDVDPAGGTIIITQDTGEDLTGQIIGVRLSGTGAVLITNLPVNSPPDSLLVLVSGFENTAIGGDGSTTDPNGDTLTYTEGTPPTNGSVVVTLGTGAFVYTPNADYTGSDTFTIIAEDPDGATGTITVVVTVNPAILTLLEKLQSENPWALYDASSVVQASGSITELTDLSGNARHLTDSQTATARMTLTSGEILGSTSRCFIGDFPGATVMPAKFHAFMLVRINGSAITQSGYLLAPTNAPNSNYSWQFTTNAISGFNGFGGLASGAGGRLTVDPANITGEYMLIEFKYSDLPLQDLRANGWNSFSSFGNLPHASWTWTGLKINTSPVVLSGRQPIGIINLAIFDTTAGQLTRSQLQSIYESYAYHYPDVAKMPRRF